MDEYMFDKSINKTLMTFFPEGFRTSSHVALKLWTSKVKVLQPQIAPWLVNPIMANQILKDNRKETHTPKGVASKAVTLQSTTR